jgi:hypothetical protein
VSAITISFKVCTSPRVDLSACDSLAVLNPITAIGAAVVLAALLLFVLPAALLSCCAARTLANVERHRALPKVEGCCLPSYPAILGLGWTGFIIALVGASEIWAVLLNLWAFLGLGLVKNAVGAGGAMLATALFCLLVANVLASVVGCYRLGNMPGVGRSRTNCCCVERSFAANSAKASAGRLASSGAPSVRGANSDEAPSYLQGGGFHPAFAPQPPFAPQAPSVPQSSVPQKTQAQAQAQAQGHAPRDGVYPPPPPPPPPPPGYVSTPGFGYPPAQGIPNYPVVDPNSRAARAGAAMRYV